MRLRGPLLSLSASKQLAKTLIYKTKAGRAFATIYNKPGSKIAFTPSTSQEENRVDYSTCLGTWQALSDAAKAVYNNRAKYKSYSGWNLYLKECMEPAPVVWLGTWAKRIKITVSNDNIDANLTHFPLTLFINSSAGTGSKDITCIFDEVGANYKKIAITKADKLTEIYVEKEQWDSGNEVAVLHVSKSDSVLAEGATTDFYIYYDNAHADNDTYVGATNDEVAENVWDDNFKMVQHLPDGADNAHTYDSTKNDNDGAKLGANQPAEADAKIGKGQNFDGNDDYIDIGVPANYNWTDYLTLEAWIYFVAGNQFYFDGWNQIGNAGWIMQRDATNVYFQIYRGAIKTAYNAKPADGWHHIVGVYDGADVKIYIDGELGSVSAAATGAFTPPNDYMSIGIYHYTFEGSKFAAPCADKMDEVRISNSARLPSWIKASYNSEKDNLASYADQETKP